MYTEAYRNKTFFNYLCPFMCTYIYYTQYNRLKKNLLPINNTVQRLGLYCK